MQCMIVICDDIIMQYNICMMIIIKSDDIIMQVTYQWCAGGENIPWYRWVKPGRFDTDHERSWENLLILFFISYTSLFIYIFIYRFLFILSVTAWFLFISILMLPARWGIDIVIGLICVIFIHDFYIALLGEFLVLVIYILRCCTHYLICFPINCKVYGTGTSCWRLPNANKKQKTHQN